MNRELRFRNMERKLFFFMLKFRILYSVLWIPQYIENHEKIHKNLDFSAFLEYYGFRVVESGAKRP